MTNANLINILSWCKQFTNSLSTFPALGRLVDSFNTSPHYRLFISVVLHPSNILDILKPKHRHIHAYVCACVCVRVGVCVRACVSVKYDIKLRPSFEEIWQIENVSLKVDMITRFTFLEFIRSKRKRNKYARACAFLCMFK